MKLNNIHIVLGEQLLLCIKQYGNQALITYGDLCEKANNIIAPRNSAGYLGDLSVVCYENNMPLISVMVVNGDTYMPGAGFFKLYHDLTGEQELDEEKIFKAELQKVRAYTGWGTFSEMLGISVEFPDTSIKLSKNTSQKTYEEGKIVLKQHIQRERNPQVIKDAKKMFVQNNGRVFCEVCGFDFEQFYGEIGKGMIEGHHMKPVSEMVDGDETKIEDIKMVCANCHRIIHKNINLDLGEIKRAIALRGKR